MANLKDHDVLTTCMSSEHSSYLVGMDQTSYGLKPTPFENRMVANQRYRQTVQYEMNLLCTKIALESLESNFETSKKLAEQTEKYFKNRIERVVEEDKNELKKILEILDKILQNHMEQIDAKNGLTIIEKLNKKTKDYADEAKSSYYKSLI